MKSEHFEGLTMPLFEQLYNFAHWLAGNRADAEDLVQETYAKALKGFGSFEEGTNLRAWMYRILRNTFLTSRAGLAAMRTASLEDGGMEVEWKLAHEATPEVHVMQQESREGVMRALESLPVEHREIVLLCDVEEMSYREIAQILAVPQGTVMSRLSRARRRLREKLDGASLQAEEGRKNAG